jgi:RIO-like serine/threonine protein kinase
MTNSAKTSKKHLTISDLYPDLTPAQQQDAEYFLRRYIDLIKRIYERVEREKQQTKEPLSEPSKTDDNLTD